MRAQWYTPQPSNFWTSGHFQQDGETTKEELPEEAKLPKDAGRGEATPKLCPQPSAPGQEVSLPQDAASSYPKAAVAPGGS